MIIEVQIEGEASARRYRVQRDNETLCIRRLSTGDNGDGPGEDAAQVDWRIPEPHVYSLLIDGCSYDVHIDADENDEGTLAVHLMSNVVRVQATDARKRRIAKSDTGPAGLARLTAPMPGRVVSVLAPEGTEVARGDGIIVLEAMKMENEIKAPRDGTVTAVLVEAGQGIESGALLATIE